MTMSQIDVDSLLKEMSAEAPCGEDLEYDPEFGEMERAAQVKSEQQIGDTVIPAQEVDWPDIKKRTTELFSRTKDLRVAIFLTQSLLHTEGFSGLRDGLALIQGLLEQYWEAVHPQLDPDDNNNPTLRVNILSSLCAPDSMLHSIREAILLNSKVFGRLSLRDILISSGKLSLPSSSSEKPVESSTIDAAFMDAQLDELQSTAEAIHQSIESAKTIESLLMDKVGVEQMADFSALPNLLKEAQHIMSEHLVSRGVGEPGAGETEVTADGSDAPANDAAGASTSQAVSQSVSGQINSREDVIRVLDMACDYFKRHEPSSPVPLLLQRAKRLVAKDFLEILRDLTPAGVTQAEDICGVIDQK